MLIHSTIQQWQTSGHKIGMITFMPRDQALSHFPHTPKQEFIPVGTAESELLCIDSSSGEVLLLEHEVAHRVYCRCAASQAQFVDALRILEDYFSKCVQSDDYWNDEAAGLNVIARATESAGGPPYGSMYHSMVGL